jgi:hypothetical protein
MQQWPFSVVRPQLLHSNPNFSKPIEVEQQFWIFNNTTKSKYTNASVLELMHQKQTNSDLNFSIRQKHPFRIIFGTTS